MSGAGATHAGPSLAGKVVIVAGGAGLLGGAIARAVVQHGGTAWIADANLAAAQAHAATLETESRLGQVHAIEIDVTSKEEILRCLDAVHAAHGRIDGIVNAAYPRTAAWGRGFFEVEYEDFCKNVGTQLGGAFLVAQQSAAYFVKQGHGNIVNIASIYGVIAPRFEVYEGTVLTSPVAYSALKAGLIHLTRYMAKYLKGKNVRVNVVSPGGILDRQPEEFVRKYNAFASTKGMLAPEDINGAVVFLLSDASMFVNGHNIVVDDGFAL